ncbi:MAG: aminotransferase [Candidatus Tectimicrobiota bacterium]|nr:MAG: aminotransferase [Candidatus Tectomicrobia bacterium]
MTTAIDYPALLARHVATSPRRMTPELFPYDFAVGNPPPEALPLQELIEATARALDREGRDLAQYLAAEGYLGLRQVIADKMARHERVTVTPEQIIVGNGSLQLIAMLIDCFIDPGDTVIVEAFTYVGTLRLLRRARARLVGIPVDEEGMRTDCLAETLHALQQQGIRPKFIYTLTNFHNPLGVDLSAARKRQLLQLATTYGVPIIEDDVYGDLRMEGDTPPSMLAMDTAGSVVWLGTFSKILAAGVRLGWAVVPPALFPYLIDHKLDSATNTFASLVVAEYLRGRLDERVQEVVAVYRSKRDALLAALERHFAGRATWTRPKGGMFLWLTLADGTDTEAALEQARRAGVNYYPGVAFSAMGDSGRNSLRLAYGYPPLSAIEEGVARLAEVLATPSH